MIPKVDVDQVSEGLIGVFAAMTVALNTLGNDILAVFLDMVPERGEQLWTKFRDFQRDKGGDGDFNTFILSTVASFGFKVFYPKDCVLERFTKLHLSNSMLQAVCKVSVRTTDFLDFPKIYFMEPGPVLDAAKNVCCKGCGMSECPNYNIVQRERRR